MSPGSTITLTITVAATTAVAEGSLVETLPAGWTVTQADGGTADATAGTVSWSVGALAAGSTVSRTLELVAPAIPTPDGAWTVPSTFAARLDQAAVSDQAAPVEVLVAPRIVVPQFTLAQLAGTPPEATYELPGAPIVGEQRFAVFRVRFEVRNPDSVPVSWSPELGYTVAGGPFTALPAGQGSDGIAFYAAPEWVPNPGPGGGTMLGPLEATIEAASLATDAKGAQGEVIVSGQHSMGVNPIPSVDLPPLSTSAVEFSVRATVDARYLGSYAFRLTDASASIAGAIEAPVTMGPQPDLALTPGQRDGAPAGTADGGPTVDPARPRYALLASTTAGLAAVSGDSIHGPYTLTSDACGACHRLHTAAGQSLTAQAPPQYNLCVACHDGSQAPGAANVKTSYSAAPSNDPTTRTYYQHDPSQVTGHTTAETDVFAGVSNRHAECADCHNPHRAAATPDSSPDAAGWTVPGRLQGASGVSVQNGAPETAPIYTLVPAVTIEYQLCFKCHSGYTQLLPNPTPSPGAPTPYTQFELDKGVELNPNNRSYHPIEAAGTNATPAMDASLAGTSPYKLWNFTTASTIRCQNCHADSAKLPGLVPVPSPAAGDGSSLPVHASQNRGILIQPYRDRDLKGWVEAYNSQDFALCYSCHAEAPFVDTTGNLRPDTNFRYHGLHVSGQLQGHGSNTTSIDTPGNGGGLATCSECHFRIHSTTYAVRGQAIDGQRLVNFAPDVIPEPLSGTLAWTAKTATQSGTCTLSCHGQPHRPEAY